MRFVANDLKPCQSCIQLLDAMCSGRLEYAVLFQEVPKIFGFDKAGYIGANLKKMKSLRARRDGTN